MNHRSEPSSSLSNCAEAGSEVRKPSVDRGRDHADALPNDDYKMPEQVDPDDGDDDGDDAVLDNGRKDRDGDGDGDQEVRMSGALPPPSPSLSRTTSPSPSFPLLYPQSVHPARYRDNIWIRQYRGAS